MTVLENERAAATAAVADVIDRDLPCVRCSYNLRGLPAQAKDPCGREPRAPLPVRLEDMHDVIADLERH